MIAIIDGCGANITSIQFALARLQKNSELTHDPQKIKGASHVILPGVGAAKHAMHQLAKLNLIDTLRNLQQPVLGICLGMQLLYDASAEGDINCLGIIPGKIAPIPPVQDLPIPHMGWNQIHIQDPQTPLLAGIENHSHVYFVHSFCAPIADHTGAITHYGSSFSAMVAKKNFYGVQFHPEKSGVIGEKILANFLQLE